MAAPIFHPGFARRLACGGAASCRWLLQAIVALLLMQAAPAVAASSDALLVMVTGDVRVLRSARDWTSMRPVARGDTLQSGDTVVTGDDGRAQLRFSDGALVTLQPRSRFRIDEYRFDSEGQRGFFSLLRGALRTSTGTIGKRSHDEYQLRTPTATVGVRGTEFELEYTECDPQCSPGSRAGLRVTVHDGRVVVANRAGTVELPAGSSLHVGSIDAAPMPVATRAGSGSASKPLGAGAAPAGASSPAAPMPPASTSTSPAPGAPTPTVPPGAPASQSVPSDFRRPGNEAAAPGLPPVARADLAVGSTRPASPPPARWVSPLPSPARLARPTSQPAGISDDPTQPYGVGDDAALPHR